MSRTERACRARALHVEPDAARVQQHRPDVPPAPGPGSAGSTQWLATRGLWVPSPRVVRCHCQGRRLAERPAPSVEAGGAGAGRSVKSREANASEAGMIMEHRIESVMTTEVVTARPSTPFRELVDLLQRKRISALPVVDQDDRLVGIVSEADLLVKQGYPHGGDDVGLVHALRHRQRLGKAAGICALDVMTRQVVSVPVGTEVAAAARLMIRLGIKRLPVVDGQGRLAGIVTRGDLLKVFLRPDQAISWEAAHEIVQGRIGIPRRAVAVETRDGMVSLTGQVERRSQVTELVRQVQAVHGVVSVDARLTWNVDDVTPMAAWPIA